MMRTAGEWVGKIRRMTADMRAQTGIDDILREEGIDGIAELRTLLRGERALAARRGAAPSHRPYDAYTSEPDPALEFPVEGPDAAGALPDDLIEDGLTADAPSPAEAPAPAEESSSPVEAPSPETATSGAEPKAPSEEPALNTDTPPPSVRPPPPSASRAPAPPSRPKAPSQGQLPPLPGPRGVASASGALRAPGPRSEPPRPPRSTPPTIADKADSFPPPPVTPRVSPPRATTLRETPQSKAPVAPVETFGAPSEPSASSSRPDKPVSPGSPAPTKGGPTST